MGQRKVEEGRERPGTLWSWEPGRGRKGWDDAEITKLLSGPHE